VALWFCNGTVTIEPHPQMLRLLLVKKSDSASMQIVTGGSYGRLLGMSRISGSDKLACAQQADYGETTGELCLSPAKGFIRN